MEENDKQVLLADQKLKNSEEKFNKLLEEKIKKEEQFQRYLLILGFTL